jgi:hypothetical protein
MVCVGIDNERRGISINSKLHGYYHESSQVSFLLQRFVIMDFQHLLFLMVVLHSDRLLTVYLLMLLSHHLTWLPLARLPFTLSYNMRFIKMTCFSICQKYFTCLNFTSFSLHEYICHHIDQICLVLTVTAPITQLLAE